MCQRYFQRMGAVGYGFTYTSAASTAYYPISGEMRTLPTLTSTAPDGSFPGSIFDNGSNYLITTCVVKWMMGNIMRIDAGSSSALPINHAVIVDLYYDFLLDAEIY